jgi:hypothetical protein
MEHIRSPGAPPVYQQVLGWLGVALAVLLAALVGSLAGSRGLADGWPLLGEMLVLMTVSLTSLRRPRLGAGLFLLAGMTIVGLFAIPRMMAGELDSGQGLQMAQVIGLFVLVGGLFWLGRPSRSGLAAALLLTMPLLALVTAGIMTPA